MEETTAESSDDEVVAPSQVTNCREVGWQLGMGVGCLRPGSSHLM